MSAVLCLTLFMILLNGSQLYSEATHGYEHRQRRDNDQGIQEQKINVDGVDINYMRTGTGDHPVLLLPGALCSSWYNFKPQIEGLDREKFTIIAWDPPGYGKSRPPSRTFPVDWYARDASWARNLMKTLGFETFSLVGMGDGGVTALTLAGNYPENVRKLVATSAQANITFEQKLILKVFRNIDNLPAISRDMLVANYGEDYSRTMWADYVDGFENIYTQRNGSLCNDALPKIRAPTLIVHGRNDKWVPISQAIYLIEHIQGVRLKIIENATHHVQLQHPQEYNTVVTNFLTEGIVT